MLSTLDYANRWIDYGISPIPLAPRSKLPMLKWLNWTDKLPSKDLASRWFDPRYKRNIGLCCGMRNLVVIDFDNMQYYASWRENLTRLWQRILDKTYQVKTSRGIHFYLRTVEPERTRKYKEGIDVKGIHSFVVSPPSVHPSGAVYTCNDHSILLVDHTTGILPYPVIPEPTIPMPDNEWSCIEESHENLSIRDIKGRIGILDVISGYTRMFKTSANGRWWMGRCPAQSHRDMHPSFRADTKTNRCTCLSGGCILYDEKGMDIFDFYCKMNGVNLKQAVEDFSRLC